MVLLLLCTLSAFAQNKVITVSGRVVEEDTKEPVEMATVQLLALPDSTQAAGITTQKQGAFTLPKVKAGKYVLKISYIGFITQNIPLQLSEKAPAKNMGTIALQSDAVMLSEAVITAEAPPVTVKADTTEYNASAYRVAEGAMLEELVKKIPGAEVDKDGKITLNGKEIKKIMVDGKDFFSDDPSVSMKNLPANMVEKVKAYDKKSDMARITGIDDGEEEAVLDLTVKKGMKKGWIGNLIAGYGSDERYEAGAMVSRFKDDASISIIGAANNTNNKGFSEFGDAGQGLSGGNAGSGITTTRSLGVNFAKDTKRYKWEVTFNMVILIMMPVGRVQRKHFWENSLRLVPVKIRHVVNGTTCVWIFVWSGGRIRLLRLFSAPVAVIRKQTRKMLPDRIPGIIPTTR